MTRVEKIILAAALAIGVSFGARHLGFAQNLTPSPGPGSQFNASIESYNADFPVTVAALTGCSTGGSPTVVGNQKGALVTAGTGTSTTCTLTWPVSKSVAPNCAVTGHTAAAGLPSITVESTTVLTWTWPTTTASTVWDVVCVGPR